MDFRYIRCKKKGKYKQMSKQKNMQDTRHLLEDLPKYDVHMWIMSAINLIQGKNYIIQHLCTLQITHVNK